MANQYEIKVKVKTDGTSEIVGLGKSFQDTSAGIVSASDQIARIEAFKKLKGDVVDSEKAWKESTEAVRLLAVELESTENPTKKLSKEFEQAKERAARLKGEYTDNSRALAALRKSLSGSGVDTKALATEQHRLQQELTESRAKLAENAKILNARNTLGVRSYQEIREEIGKLNNAYDTLKASGRLTHAELLKAKTELKRKTSELVEETNGWSKSIGMTRSAMVALAGVGYTLSSAMSRVSAIVGEAGTASFAMEASVRAANREFSDTGSLDQWEGAVKRLSGEMQIYSETALKSAISRTVDMTKRLGLSSDQMEEVIRRSGDLGAGKVELEGAVERVTAALRGEAESAEYLGLTLNEEYVKGWYEAKAGQDKAWKSLTDVEKAQVRYQAFLEQSDGMQGRAAESAGTYAGAMALVKKEITDAITNNEDVIGALNKVASVLRDNSDDIAKAVSAAAGMIAGLIEGVAGLVAWYQDLGDGTKTLIGTFGAFLVTGGLLHKFIRSDLAVGLKGMLAHLKDGTAGMDGMGSAAKGLAGALRGGLYAALVLTVAKTAEAYLAMRDAQKEAAASSIRLEKAQERLAGKLAKVSQDTGLEIKTFRDLIKAKEDGLIVLDKETHQWTLVSSARGQAAIANQAAADQERMLAKARIAGYESSAKAIQDYADTAIAETERQVAKQLITEQQSSETIIGITVSRYQQLIEAARQHAQDVAVIDGEGSGAHKAAVEQEKALTKDLADYKAQAAKDATDLLKTELGKQLDDEKRIKGEIEALHQKAVDQRIQKEDELREIRRRGMSEDEQQADLERQANEKLLAAKEALRLKDYDRANALAAQSKGIYNGLKDEETALDGVTESWKVLESATADEERAKQDELAKTQESIRNLRTSIDNVVSAIEQIAKTFTALNAKLAAEPITPKMDTTEVDQGLAVIEKIDGAYTESTHVMHFEGEGSTVKPISEKIDEIEDRLAHFRGLAAQGVDGVTHFRGEDSGGEGGLSEMIAAVQEKIDAFRAAAEDPITMTANMSEIESAMQEIETAAGGTAQAQQPAPGKDALQSMEVDDSKYRPENDEVGIEVDAVLAQQIENKKTALAMYQNQAEASRAAQDGLWGTWRDISNQLFAEIKLLEREMAAKKKKKGYALGGVVPGAGTGDTVPAMLTPQEFVAPVPSVRAYGVSFFEALRRRAIPREAVRALMSGPRYNLGGLVRSTAPSFSLPELPAQYLNSGGSVRPPAQMERVQVDFNFGRKSYSGVFGKSEAAGMISELKNQKARAL